MFHVFGNGNYPDFGFKLLLSVHKIYAPLSTKPFLSCTFYKNDMKRLISLGPTLMDAPVHESFETTSLGRYLGHDKLRQALGTTFLEIC
jgi:hypothetical protein